MQSRLNPDQTRAKAPTIPTKQKTMVGFQTLLWWLLVLAFCAVVCIAPKGLGTSAALAIARASEGSSHVWAGAAAAATATAVAARMAASWAMKEQPKNDTAPAHLQGAKRSTTKASKGIPLSEFVPAARSVAAAHGESEEADGVGDDAEWEEVEYEYDSDEEEWAGGEEEGEGEEDAESDADGTAASDAGGVRARTSPGAGKSWTKAQFPAGVTNPYNWDIRNLQAAQAWSCPCADRRNCIGADRLCVLKLYDFRQRFREQFAPANGGLRDATRSELQNHFDETKGCFSRSFVVGPLGDCCAESAALAKGLSFQTFAKARADVTKGRPTRVGRNRVRQRQESEERAHFRAWIRAERASMEGPKGGSDPVDKWKTPYLPRSKRWEVYKESRRRASQPIIGSEALLYALVYPPPRSCPDALCCEMFARAHFCMPPSCRPSRSCPPTVTYVLTNFDLSHPCAQLQGVG